MKSETLVLTIIWIFAAVIIGASVFSYSEGCPLGKVKARGILGWECVAK